MGDGAGRGAAGGGGLGMPDIGADKVPIQADLRTDERADENLKAMGMTPETAARMLGVTDLDFDTITITGEGSGVAVRARKRGVGNKNADIELRPDGRGGISMYYGGFFPRGNGQDTAPRGIGKLMGARVLQMADQNNISSVTLSAGGSGPGIFGGKVSNVAMTGFYVWPRFGAISTSASHFAELKADVIRKANGAGVRVPAAFRQAKTMHGIFGAHLRKGVSREDARQAQLLWRSFGTGHSMVFNLRSATTRKIFKAYIGETGGL